MDAPSPFLDIPTARDARWRLIERALAKWYPPDAGRDVPTGHLPPVEPPTPCSALQEWFSFACRQPGIWCRQDALFCGHCYELDSEHLIIGVENQSCAFWGVRRVDLVLDDPPVYLDAHNGGWILESETVSGFAVAWLAAAIKFSEHNHSWANGPASTRALLKVASHYPHLGLPNLHWPHFPTRFYGTADLLLEVDGDDEDIWFWLATRSDEAFRRFQALMEGEVRWESSSDEWPSGWVTSTLNSK